MSVLYILCGQAPVLGWQARFPQSHTEVQLTPYWWTGHVLLQLQTGTNSERWAFKSKVTFKGNSFHREETTYKYHCTLTSHHGSPEDTRNFLSHDHSGRDSRFYTGIDNYLRRCHLCRVCYICREGSPAWNILYLRSRFHHLMHVVLYLFIGMILLVQPRVLSKW